MPSFRTGKVVTLLEQRPGLQRVEVDLGDGPERAYALSQLTGPVAVGDRVVMNTTAVELGLGTGGWHVVHWNLARDEWHERGPGHIIKGRYTSIQSDVGSAEEHLESLAEVESISGMPVVAAALHSQVPALAVAFKHRAPGARLAYVMTDGAGLPLAMSDLVAALRARNLLDATITAGHAFGGDYEAVSIYSALAVARHVAHADAAVVAMGLERHVLDEAHAELLGDPGLRVVVLPVGRQAAVQHGDVDAAAGLLHAPFRVDHVRVPGPFAAQRRGGPREGVASGRRRRDDGERDQRQANCGA